MIVPTTAVELTTDRAFTHRIRRLVWISALALGVIWVLAFVEGAPPWALLLVAAGWVLMPVLLAASIRQPALRLLLVAPAGCASLGLIGVTASAGPDTTLGWAMVTAGVLFGGTLGMWLWYRWAPVPPSFDSPFGLPRIGLIAVHVGLILFGLGLVVAGL